MGLLRARTLLVVLLLTLMVAPIAVAGQSENETTTASPETSKNATQIIAVGDRLTVVDYRFTDGAMVVELDSEVRQPVDVADLFGSVPESGGASTVETRTVSVPKGRSSVTVPAEPYNGLAVVTVAAPGGTVTLAERVSSPMIGGPWTVDDARSAGLGALVGSLALVGLLGFRKVRGVGSDVRRLI